MTDETNLCLDCKNFDGETCMEQYINKLTVLPVLNCSGYVKEQGFKRDEYGNPICDTCGGDLVIFRAEPGDVQGICPTCDNSPPERVFEKPVVKTEMIDFLIPEPKKVLEEKKTLRRKEK